MRIGGRGVGAEDCAKAEVAISTVMAEKKICFRMVGDPKRTSIRPRNEVKRGIDGSKAKSVSVFFHEGDFEDPFHEWGFCVRVGLSIVAMLCGEALLQFGIFHRNVCVSTQIVTER